MASSCPSEETLTRFDEGSLTDAERSQVISHVEGCAGCRQVVAALTGLRISRTMSSPVRDVPVVLDRYRVLGEIGRGAVGRVYAAEDSVLGRKVALKVVHDTSQVLLRESRAVARLSHRNVITVHDVVLRDDWGFLSMEYVDGGNLAQWLETPRSTDEVLDVFVQVAEGLDAAHRAGLVHRDLKPANVLLASDGRACVTDFGLASVAGDAVVETLTGPPGAPRRLLGTPAYMAPEQFDGGPVTPATDQFAFFVALHEALGGARPFEGTSVESLGLAVREGRRRAPPRALPPRLQALVERGLSLDATKRFPSMHAVVTALKAQRGPRRRGAWLAGGVVALAAVGAMAWWAQRPRCPPLAGRETVWTAPQRTAVTAALAGDAEASKVILDALDETARELDAAWRRSCDDQRTTTQTARTQLCLAEALSQLDVAAQVLASMPIESASRAVPVVRTLPRPADCARIETLAERPPPPSAEPARTLSREAAALLLQAEALRRLGRHHEGLEHATRALDRARRANDSWQLADALRLQARLHNNLGEYDKAEDIVRRAVEAARTTGDTLLIGRTAFTWAFVECLNVLNPERCRDARALLDEMAARRPVDELLAAQAEMRAAAAGETGDVEVATAEVKRARSYWEKVPQAAEDHMRVLIELENALVVDGRDDEALVISQQLAREGLEFYGANHPRTAQLQLRPLQVLADLGRFGEARRLQPAVEERVVRLTGTDSADYRDVVSLESRLCLWEGRPECLLALTEKRVGKDAGFPGVTYGRVYVAMQQAAVVERIRLDITSREDWRTRAPTIDAQVDVRELFDITPPSNRALRQDIVKRLKELQEQAQGRGNVAAEVMLRAADAALDADDVRTARQELSLPSPSSPPGLKRTPPCTSRCCAVTWRCAKVTSRPRRG